jgi:hypothetical protein
MYIIFFPSILLLKGESGFFDIRISGVYHFKSSNGVAKGHHMGNCPFNLYLSRIAQAAITSSNLLFCNLEPGYPVLFR